MICRLCERDSPTVHKHHLIPRVVWKRLKRRRQVKGDAPMVELCNDCGRQIHMLFTEKELAKMTWDELKDHPDTRKYVEWVKDRPKELGKIRQSRKVRG